jgi:hypothetical protein
MDQWGKTWHRFTTWYRSLSAIQARNVAVGDPDLAFQPQDNVTKEEVVSVFLQLHPEYMFYREALLNQAADTFESFTMNTEKWTQEKAKLRYPFVVRVLDS